MYAPPLDGIESIRRHGLQRPWNAMQMLAWALYVLLFVYFFAFLFPMLWTPSSGPDGDLVSPLVGAAMCLFAAAAGGSAALTSLIDPADSAVLRLPSTTTDDRVLCYLCDVRVHSSSRHCRLCNKCVVDFDHHCKWLNTCVGKNNYRYFLCLIAAVTLETVLLLTLTVLFIVESFGGWTAGSELLKDRAADAFGDSLGGEVGLRIVLITCGAVLVPVVALVVQLAGFHTMLVYRNLTTYDYIVGEQKRQRENKAAKKLELQNTKSNRSTNRAGDKKTIPQSQQQQQPEVPSQPMPIDIAQPDSPDDDEKDKRGPEISDSSNSSDGDGGHEEGEDNTRDGGRATLSLSVKKEKGGNNNMQANHARI